MSIRPHRRTLLKLFLIAFFGFALAYFISVRPSPEPSHNAKLFFNKKQFTEIQKRQIAGKANAMMDIQIEALNGIPQNDEQEVTLKARLTLKRPVDSPLKFKWLLPDEVKIVEGNPEDEWYPVPQLHQEVSTEITVVGMSKESPGRTVVLHVESSSQGYKIGYSGVFVIESEIENVDDRQQSTSAKKSGQAKVQTQQEIYSERLKGISF